MYEYSKMIPSSWNSEATLHKLFPYDQVETVSIKPYPMVKSSNECELYVMIHNSDAVGFALDRNMASAYLEEYLSDLGVDYEVRSSDEEESNMFKFIVDVLDFENYVLEKVSSAKDSLSNLVSSLDVLESMEYSSVYDDYPGWSNGKVYMSMTEKVPSDLIRGSSNLRVKKWGPTDWSAFKESIKNLTLGKPVCDQNPIRLIRIGDDYYVGADGFNRVCACKYLGVPYVSAIVETYDYDVGGIYSDEDGFSIDFDDIYNL